MKARSLIFRVACALLLLLVGGLTPLAYASPPDPSWIRGIYDDDYDNVIVMITSAAATTAPVTVVELRLLPPLAGMAAQRTDGPVPTRPFSPLQSRAPPTP